ncbi:MAG: heavy metal-binding domain-containing protein [Shewanella sp.]
MKTIISLILSTFILVSIVPTVSAHDHVQQQEHAQHHEMKADHACPMHPEVTGKKGDTCPKCGMNLTAVKSDTNGQNCDNCPHHKSKVQTTSADTHACPMNPAITGKAGETCPKCGMNLEPIKAEADTKAMVKHQY